MKIADVLFEMQYDFIVYAYIKHLWYDSDWYRNQTTAHHVPPIFHLVDALCGSSMS